MGEESGIGWLAVLLPDGTWKQGNTFNSWIGCQRWSPGCVNCYAEDDWDRRRGHKNWGFANTTERHITSDAYWRKPLTWDRKAAMGGYVDKVFWGSYMDAFEHHQQLAAPRQRVFELIEQTPHLAWLVLTKRIENVAAMVPEHWMRDGFPENVWLGTSVENQEYAESRIPVLLSLPAKVRWLSVEPMLGPVDLGSWLLGYTRRLPGPDWVVVGGESGANYRPMELAWAEQIKRQCDQAGVAFFGKQASGLRNEIPLVIDGKEWKAWPDGTVMV